MIEPLNDKKENVGLSDSNVGLGIEPDLSSLMSEGYKTTWGEKKKACIYEARQMWQAGKYSLSDNPFIEGTWAHKWWHDEYADCDD